MQRLFAWDALTFLRLEKLYVEKLPTAYHSFLASNLRVGVFLMLQKIMSIVMK